MDCLIAADIKCSRTGVDKILQTLYIYIRLSKGFYCFRTYTGMVKGANGLHPMSH